MDPVIAQAFSGLIVTVSAVLMMWATRKFKDRDDD